MITRYGPFSKVLQDISIAMEIACFSHREIALSILDNVRIVPSVVESLLYKVGLSDFEDVRKGSGRGQPFPNLLQ